MLSSKRKVDDYSSEKDLIAEKVNFCKLNIFIFSVDSINRFVKYGGYLLNDCLLLGKSISIPVIEILDLDRDLHRKK
jgi:hypothetical protein